MTRLLLLAVIAAAWPWWAPAVRAILAEIRAVAESDGAEGAPERRAPLGAKPRPARRPEGKPWVRTRWVNPRWSAGLSAGSPRRGGTRAEARPPDGERSGFGG